MKKHEESIINKYAKGDILDLGCAYGRCFPMLSKKGNYIGVDIRQEQIDLARKTYGNDWFMWGDAMAIDFENDTFDTIFCGFNVLDEVTDLDKALSEIFRTLRDDGVLIFSFHNILNWKCFLRSRYTSWNKNRKVNMMNPYSLVRLMEAKGFKYITRYGSMLDAYPYYIFTVDKQ